MTFSGLLVYRYIYIYIYFTHVIGLNMYWYDSNDEGDNNNEDSRNNHILRLRVGKTACYYSESKGEWFRIRRDGQVKTDIDYFFSAGMMRPK